MDAHPSPHGMHHVFVNWNEAFGASPSIIK
jgi:hypothetical protein